VVSDVCCKTGMYVLLRALGLSGRLGKRYRKRIRTNPYQSFFLCKSHNDLYGTRMIRNHTYAYPERPEEDLLSNDLVAAQPALARYSAETNNP
jgi:hypothetical protein